jgi:hypothetical protein
MSTNLSNLFSKHILKGYIIGGGTYTFTGTYLDVKSNLNKYRFGNLDDYDKKRFTTETEYLRYCMFDSSTKYLFTAWLWPIMFPVICIPSLVSKMNPETKN